MTPEQIHQSLIKPFPLSDIEFRVQRCGIDKNGNPWAMVLTYVTNRAIQARLDEVFGVFGWCNEYRDIPGGGVECCISVLDRDSGQWVGKWDAAENTQVEATKGGRSGAMKRAAVQWGIGRYLYNLDTMFAICRPDGSGQNKQQFKGKNNNQVIYGSWDNPQLPEWAIGK